MVYGQDKFSYDLIPVWGKLPSGWKFPDVSNIAIDNQNRVYVINRSENPVAIFDSDGNLLTSWGGSYFNSPHGIGVSANYEIFCTDVNNHTVSKFDFNGKLLMVLGSKGKPSNTGFRTDLSYEEGIDTIAGGQPFNRPTGVAIGNEGHIYVSDGYGNARVHKFAPDGKWLLSWGEPGKGGMGKFRIPHHVFIDKHERVWIADRENNLVQVFDANGKFLFQWSDVIRPTSVFVDKYDNVFVSDFGFQLSIFNSKGTLFARWGSDGMNKETDLFVAAHAVAVDSYGDIYVGEVARTYAQYDRGGRTLMKFVHRNSL